MLILALKMLALVYLLYGIAWRLIRATWNWSRQKVT
jgi:hypothetical protein